jgi:hypothetical protein
MLRKQIPKVCFYFCCTERNSELFSLPRNGLERDSESLLLFLFHGTAFREFASFLFYGTEFREFLSLAEWFEKEFLEFSVPGNSRNFVGTNHLFCVFRLLWNYFFVGNFQYYLCKPNFNLNYPSKKWKFLSSL